MIDPAELNAAVTALRSGQVVGFPTDTVYGVGVDPSQPLATSRLYSLKARPLAAALPVLVDGMEQTEALVGEVPAFARRLTERYWPGALTIVLSRQAGVAWDLGGDSTTIGLRCPAHPVALALCQAVGPIATTSANRHGAPPVTSAGAVSAALPGVAMVLDGGVCAGTPSTVVDCTGASVRILRVGRVAADEVAAVAGGRRPVDLGT